MHIAFVKRGSPEWDYMWRAFEPDTAEMDEHTGEVWQYMGTVRVASISPWWAHEFRHRNHPKTQRRECRRIPASAGFKP